MRQRILAALAILLGEPIPHDWTDCPNEAVQWSWTWPVGCGEASGPIRMGYDDNAAYCRDWETVS
jgi:hypothetical protein